eukprot:scaffold33397_cov96-Isochrysis_galbana.AAC.1
MLTLQTTSAAASTRSTNRSHPPCPCTPLVSAQPAVTRQLASNVARPMISHWTPRCESKGSRGRPDAHVAGGDGTKAPTSPPPSPIPPTPPP